ncbi:MAG: radical SAM protein [Spirochaetaceae bacterium]|nr:radical SAM protein [Spirochaetaceae bacterium]
MAFSNIFISHCKAFIKRFFPDSVKRRMILNYMRKQAVGRRKVKTALGFEVSVCDHCNLNCVSCEHFSPIADETFLDIEQYEKDCKRLSELFGGEIAWLHLMGGEPLLHPRLIEILEISRRYFKSGSIELVSNGILLLKQSDLFWETCRKNDITVAVTQYPIKLDHKLIERKAVETGIRFRYYFIGHKTMHKKPLDINGRQNIAENLSLCHKFNTCVQLVSGKLYTCIEMAYIKYFNKYYNQNLVVDENDSIDIYKAKTKHEILEKLAKPVSFCKYCDIKNTDFGIEWRVSKKEISEWT